MLASCPLMILFHASTAAAIVSLTISTKTSLKIQGMRELTFVIIYLFVAMTEMKTPLMLLDMINQIRFVT